MDKRGEGGCIRKKGGWLEWRGKESGREVERGIGGEEGEWSEELGLGWVQREGGWSEVVGVGGGGLKGGWEGRRVVGGVGGWSEVLLVEMVFSKNYR